LEKGNTVNLLGRTTHALIAVEFFSKGNIKGFQHYAKDFISITEKEIRKAFYFLTPEFQKGIVERFQETQDLLKNQRETKDNLEKILVNLQGIFYMLSASLGFPLRPRAW
jgi:hypothetical protein